MIFALEVLSETFVQGDDGRTTTKYSVEGHQKTVKVHS